MGIINTGMIYLILVVLLNVFVFSLFKLFPKYGVNALQAIVVNYWVCVLTGLLYRGDIPFEKVSMSIHWMPWAIGMGALFIVMFNLLAYSTGKVGIATTTISNKLSLIIPVVSAYFLYGDHLGVIELCGIILSIPAVVLTATRKKVSGSSKFSALLLPLMIFIGSGALDVLLKYVEHSFLPTDDLQSLFTIYVFVLAASLGTLMVVYNVLFKSVHITAKSIVAGIVLGVPNFFSIFLFVKLFNTGLLESSAIVPINNISILVLSSLVAFVFFKEDMTKRKLMGVVLSVVSILLIVIGEFYGW